MTELRILGEQENHPDRLGAGLGSGHWSRERGDPGSEGSGVLQARTEGQGTHQAVGTAALPGQPWCPRAGIIWVPGGEKRDDKVTESPREK